MIRDDNNNFSFFHVPIQNIVPQHHPHTSLPPYTMLLTPTTTTLSTLSTSTITTPLARRGVLLVQPLAAAVTDVTLLALVRGGGEVFAPAVTTQLDLARVRMHASRKLTSLRNNLVRLARQRMFTSLFRRQRNRMPGRVAAKPRRSICSSFVAIVTSILSGAYTTVIFTLLPLYSKTALGRGYDAQFWQFWAATAGLRETGFLAFLACLIVSFEMAFGLSLFIRTTGVRQKVLVGLATVLSILSFTEWIWVSCAWRPNSSFPCTPKCSIEHYSTRA